MWWAPIAAAIVASFVNILLAMYVKASARSTEVLRADLRAEGDGRRLTDRVKRMEYDLAGVRKRVHEVMDIKISDMHTRMVEMQEKERYLLLRVEALEKRAD